MINVKINSEAWISFNKKVEAILKNVPEFDYKGNPINDGDQVFKDAVDKLMNLSLDINGKDNIMFTAQTATSLIFDELDGRRQNQDEAEAMMQWSQYNYAINLGGKNAQ